MENTMDSVLDEYEKWREACRGSTTDELLALEGKRDPFDLVYAFDEALGRKFERAVGEKMSQSIGRDALTAQIWDFDAGRVARGPLTEEELIVLAIVELQRYVRNGGFDAFFCYSAVFAPIIGKALRRIGRPDLAEIAERAVECLGVSKQEFKGNEYFDKVEEAVFGKDHEDAEAEKATEEINAKVKECTNEFFDIYDDILDSLFEFIKANRDKIIVGPQEWGPQEPDPSAPPIYYPPS